jgi:chromosome segregation ATPase
MQFSNLSFEEFLRYGDLPKEAVTRIREYVASELGNTEDYEDQISDLERDKESLDDENYDLSNKIEELEDQIEQMQDRIDELEKTE